MSIFDVPVDPNKAGVYVRDYDQRIGNGGLPQGIEGTANRAYTRTVNPSELVSSQLASLTNPNSAYIKQARAQAFADANARGGIGSSYAMGNAQGAAIRAALPIAQADADAQQKAQTENLGYLNQYDIARMNANAAGAGASSAAAAQAAHDEAVLRMQRESLAYNGEQAGLQRSFQTSQTYLNHILGLDNMSQQQQYNVENAQLGGALGDFYGSRKDSRDAFNSILKGGYSTLFNNPDAWNNPEGALGMMSMFGNYAGNQIDQYNGGYTQPSASYSQPINGFADPYAGGSGDQYGGYDYGYGG